MKPVLFVVFIIVTTAPSHTCAKAPSHQVNKPVTVATPSPTPNVEEQKLALDRDRFVFEKEKFEHEKQLDDQKLAQEATRAWLNAASLVLPLFAALGTLCYSIWSFRKQIQQNVNQQSESAKLQFEIKAAEIAFAGKTPEAVAHRAQVLKTMFDNRLPDSFPSPFDPQKVGGGKEPSEEKLLLFQALANHYDLAAELIALWDELFPDKQKWLDRVKPLFSKPSKDDVESKKPDV